MIQKWRQYIDMGDQTIRAQLNSSVENLDLKKLHFWKPIVTKIPKQFYLQDVFRMGWMLRQDQILQFRCGK